MRTIAKFHLLLPVAILFMLNACSEFEAPPLDAPVYTGPPANITVAELKTAYSTQPSPSVIADDLILKATIIGNDISGNIYKQLYISDNTGAINMGIDQNSVFASNRVGQEIFIRLQGLAMVLYGGELQIGYNGTNANRIPWEIYKEHVVFNGFPDTGKAKPRVVSLEQLTASMVNSLIEIHNVSFVNAGKNRFTSNNSTTDEEISDDGGNKLIVRTSAFCDFANDRLPAGKGSLTGILGRYNGGWQFIIRDRNDIRGFSESPEDSGSETVTFFSETFGTKSWPSGNRPKIADFTDFDMGPPIIYSDPSEFCDVRSLAGENTAHVWFPSNRAGTLKIEHIDSSPYSNITLSFQLSANIYNATDAMNLNAISVVCNGTTHPVPSTPVSYANGDNGKFYTITLEDIPSSANLTIEFNCDETKNTLGLRLDTIKLTGNTGGGSSTVEED